MIQINQLSHYYGQRKQAARAALLALQLAIPAHTLFALTGPNGSGKSTLFRILCGLTHPSSGSVQIAGYDMLHQAQAARQLLGVVFQQPALDKQLTVLENLRIHAELHHLDRHLFQQRLECDLIWSELGNRLHDRVGTLSGGTARRVELVKALLHRPAVLFMDEPTNGLDPGARRDFFAHLLRLRREYALTILFTSHLFDEAEQADQVGILHQGRLLAVGSPEQLRSSLGQEMVILQIEQQEDRQQLLQLLAQRPSIQVTEREQELRLQGIDAETLQQLLFQHREQFQALAIHHPTLEDVFIHHTSSKGGGFS
ncbi:ABC transporter ATP-binding protein [Candidatus Magnetaquicoccus inordinatus]|uniref:ABC transporter ATP-binding protein n=1 Tax=Candidatus Magnetaquicoccus inordinatus TaxID=2496818 RepID=UPI00102D1EE3|nr:ABC transporter ATP-binding protein [Candidatus Magnetaquicoccus inordinatus]